MERPVLSVEGLRIADNAGNPILSDISVELARGEVLALIGASGSGKTTLALTALGHLRPGLRHIGGRVALDGTDMLAAETAELRRLRGSRVAYVAQSAAASFNPRIRLMDQVTETARLHGRQDRAEAEKLARDRFAFLNLPTPERIGRRYPWQVSGGQLQRFMLAMGMQEEPLLLVCDEPTSALDVTTQVEVMRILKQAISANRTAALFVSHDLAVVAQIASRIAVMYRGRIVECGATEQILNDPQETYTQDLLAASRQFTVSPAAPRTVTAAQAEPTALRATGLIAGYGPVAEDRPAVTTLDDVSLSLDAGEVLGVIGESGSGKTTLAKVVAGLHAPTQGEVLLDGEKLRGLVGRRSREERRRVQLVFQMADTALNPRHTVGRILGRVVRFYNGGGRDAAQAEARRLLSLVQLPPDYVDREVRRLSGGEKQRVNLARALAAKPKVVICDEITSALDTVVARSIIELIDRLRREIGLAVIFVSHDLAAVADLADDILVMRRGKTVAYGPAAEVLTKAEDPYVRLLLASAPELRTGWLEEAAEKRVALQRELEAAT